MSAHEDYHGEVHQAHGDEYTPPTEGNPAILWSGCEVTWADPIFG
jgi:hypothetical protein